MVCMLTQWTAEHTMTVWEATRTTGLDLRLVLCLTQQRENFAIRTRSIAPLRKVSSTPFLFLDFHESLRACRRVFTSLGVRGINSPLCLVF